ncbi:UNVERIFIED_CONTAM: hypothetical protein FKN15_064836 [Acipenser sinensis]
MEGWSWRNGSGELENLLGGLEEQGWCLACGVYGHTVAICPFQDEEEEPAQERKAGRRSRKRRGRGCLPRFAQGCLLLRIAWGCLLLRIAWGCLLLHIAWRATSYRERGRSGVPAAASMARGSPPEFATRGSAAAAAAVASRGSAAAAAVASRGSAAAAVPPEGPLLLPLPPEGPVMWQEILWLEPHEGELPTTEKGGRSGDQLPQPHFRGRKYCGWSPMKGSCQP